VTLLDRFERFFGAVNAGSRPYPWQQALVERVAATGRWPSAIAAPTGSGKSSVVDVHIFLVAEHARQAAQGGGDMARPPRRLVLVAPRRVLVDDQFEHATRLAARLGETAGSPDQLVGDLAAALRGLVTTHETAAMQSPLGVSRLRGGVLLDQSWRLDPARCQIVCATPHMWGSRLLLRGYRGSRLARNLETGLLSHDVVAIIDEAHLHERLVDTALRVAGASQSALGLQVVAMSATRAGGGAHSLTPADLIDLELQRRVCAAKHVDCVDLDDWAGDARSTMVSRARDLHGGGTVGVFANTVGRALDLAADLQAGAERAVVLVCGRMRPADLDRLRGSYPGLLDARGNADVDYLVTTQSLEVGVDLDLPALVSEIAPAAALAQRAGRLNRSGRLDAATFCVVRPAGLEGVAQDELGSRFAPYTATDIIDGARWLDALDGDASPLRISSRPLPEPTGQPLPALSRVDLETLAMTGDPLGADIDVSLYVEEPRDSLDLAVSIGARRYLAMGSAIVRQMLLAVPPRAHELASLSLGRSLNEVLAASPGSWVVRTDDGVRTAEPLRHAADVRPGDVIVVPAGSEICTQGIIGLVRGRTSDPIDDVMDRRAEGAPDAVVPLPAEDVAVVLSEDPVLGGRVARRGLAELVVAAGDADLAARLRTHRYLSDLELHWCHDQESRGGAGLLVVRAAERTGRQPVAAVGEAPVTIESHSAAVADRMAAILAALGAQELTVHRDQLIAAAWCHDEGKRHPRFQRRMGTPPDSPPLAKPASGHVPDRGDGWRHEQLSAAVSAARYPGDALVVAVVGAHHGHGRPLFDRSDHEVLDGWTECDEKVVIELARLFGSHGRYELERSRLQRELGVHQLAFLEALLRCADMQVSREGN